MENEELMVPPDEREQLIEELTTNAPYVLDRLYWIQAKNADGMGDLSPLERAVCENELIRFYKESHTWHHHFMVIWDVVLQPNYRCNLWDFKELYNLLEHDCSMNCKLGQCILPVGADQRPLAGEFPN